MSARTGYFLRSGPANSWGANISWLTLLTLPVVRRTVWWISCQTNFCCLVLWHYQTRLLTSQQRLSTMESSQLTSGSLFIDIWWNWPFVSALLLNQNKFASSAVLASWCPHANVNPTCYMRRVPGMFADRSQFCRIRGLPKQRDFQALGAFIPFFPLVGILLVYTDWLLIFKWHSLRTAQIHCT